ncbi:hypothetical protein Tco_0885794 [Tanacetum coccineum]
MTTTSDSVRASTSVSLVRGDKVDVVKKSVVADKAPVVADKAPVVADKPANVVVADKLYNVVGNLVVDVVSDKVILEVKPKAVVHVLRSKETHVKRKRNLLKEDDSKKKVKVKMSEGKSKKEDSELETDEVDSSSNEVDRKQKKLKLKGGLRGNTCNINVVEDVVNDMLSAALKIKAADFIARMKQRWLSRFSNDFCGVSGEVVVFPVVDLCGTVDIEMILTLKEQIIMELWVMSFDGDHKQWMCGKSGTVNLHGVSSIVRDLGS